MVGNKEEPAKRERMGKGGSDFWITIRWTVVVVGIIALVFIISKCVAETPAVSERETLLEACIDECSQSFSGDKMINCLVQCKEEFGNLTTNEYDSNGQGLPIT